MLVDDLSALKPDLIALQEVRIPENNAQWLAHELEIQNVYLSPKSGSAGMKESIAILSDLPFEDRSSLDRYCQIWSVSTFVTMTLLKRVNLNREDAEDAKILEVNSDISVIHPWFF